MVTKGAPALTATTAAVGSCSRKAAGTSMADVAGTVTAIRSSTPVSPRRESETSTGSEPGLPSTIPGVLGSPATVGSTTHAAAGSAAPLVAPGSPLCPSVRRTTTTVAPA